MRVIRFYVDVEVCEYVFVYVDVYAWGLACRCVCVCMYAIMYVCTHVVSVCRRMRIGVCNARAHPLASLCCHGIGAPLQVEALQKLWLPAFVPTCPRLCHALRADRSCSEMQWTSKISTAASICKSNSTDWVGSNPVFIMV